jgi:hypothetical protein
MYCDRVVLHADSDHRTVVSVVLLGRRGPGRRRAVVVFGGVTVGHGARIRRVLQRRRTVVNHRGLVVALPVWMPRRGRVALHRRVAALLVAVTRQLSRPSHQI